jgi:MFS transporter, DHA1 family, multidrug resistance protein
MSRFFNSRPLPLIEFIPLMALVTALDALSIDSILPALPAMAQDLGVTGGNGMQLVVTLMFAGFGAGQLLGGPMADAMGRKRTIYFGLALYMAGSLLGLLATNYPTMLAARLMQGTGAAIPYVAMNALVRDLYSGAPMARIMSFIGTVFILVPMLAPLAGQGILLIATWRFIFVLYLVLAVISAVWFALRQPETLPYSRRVRISAGHIAATAAEVARIRPAVGYILCGGFLTASFLGYLSTAQQIFQVTYGTGTSFALYFSALAFSIGLSLLFNGTLVEKLGMRPMCYSALGAIVVLAVVFLPFVLAYSGVPPLWATMAYLLATFLCVGVLFGNLNALAMEPLGHIAGMGAAIVGFTSMLLGAVLGGFIGQAYDGGVTALVAGFAVMNALGILAMWWGNRKP